MTQQNSRIPEQLAAEVLAEAARLHDDAKQGYSVLDLEKACSEAQIPPHLVQLALLNVEENKFHQKQRQEQVHRQRVALVQKALKLGLALLIPTLGGIGLFIFRPQVETLFDDLIEQVAPSDYKLEDAAVSGALAVDLQAKEREEKADHINSLKEELDSLKSELNSLRSQNQALESQLSQSAEAPSLTIPTREAEPGTILREQLRKRVMGKTQQQVLDGVGRPESTSDSSSYVVWRYDNVKDEISGEIGSASVYFEQGVVDDVSFS